MLGRWLCKSRMWHPRWTSWLKHLPNVVFGRLRHQFWATLPSKGGMLYFPALQDLVRGKKNLLFEKVWREKPGKQSREQDNKPAVVQQKQWPCEHTGLSIIIPKLCPSPIGAELQHLWAMANPGPVCAKPEIYFCSPVHVCVFVVHVLMISQ